ncbi:MAG: DUF3302 domain-containing protein [Planctomycetales bacterium]
MSGIALSQPDDNNSWEACLLGMEMRVIEIPLSNMEKVNVYRILCPRRSAHLGCSSRGDLGPIGHDARPYRPGRNHPQADAISVCGWWGVLTMGLLLPLAYIWAYTNPHCRDEPRNDGNEIEEETT